MSEISDFDKPHNSEFHCTQLKNGRRSKTASLDTPEDSNDKGQVETILIVIIVYCRSSKLLLWYDWKFHIFD